MNKKKTLWHRWFGFMPQTGPGMTGFGIIIVSVFILGLIIAGGNGSGPETDSAQPGHKSAESFEAKVWTCSMHPQIQLPESGKCPICFMDLIPLEHDDGGELGPRELRMSETARMRARIQTTPVRRASADAEIRMVGRITYDETRSHTISAWVPGRIDSLYVDYAGEQVTKGEPIVYIYSPQLLSAQEELIQARLAMSTLGGGTSALRRMAEETVTAARKKLSLYGMMDDQIDAIETSGEAKDHVNIHAPASGIVVAKEAQEGEYVSIGTMIYAIADLSRLWVEFEAYETDLPWLRTGQKVEFTTPSLPGEEFTAEITFIDPLVNKRTRTVVIRAGVNNAAGRLKPDMFVSAVVSANADAMGAKSRFASDKESDVLPLVIPSSAPLITGTRAVVYVEHTRDDETVYEGREVALGSRIGDYYIVKSGLEAGERVVTNGAFKIDSELQIQARPSMMSPQGGVSGAGHGHAGHETAAVRKTTERAVKDSDAGLYIIGSAARAELTPVYEAYLQIQMDLANDDFEAATDRFGMLSDVVANVDMNLFSGDAHMTWMALAARLSRAAERGGEADDIDKARMVFHELSKTVIDLHRAFGHAGDKTLYLTFCPMAFGNTGAYWIQAVDTVYNSYFGARMLRCGEIKETYPPSVEEDS